LEVKIHVNPNTQIVAGMQTVIDFDPANITVSSVKIVPDSPIGLELQSVADNNSRIPIFAVGTLGEPATQPLDMAVTEFLESPQSSTATIEFSTTELRRTIASAQGVEFQRSAIGIEV